MAPLKVISTRRYKSEHYSHFNGALINCATVLLKCTFHNLLPAYKQLGVRETIVSALGAILMYFFPGSSQGMQVVCDERQMSDKLFCLPSLVQCSRISLRALDFTFHKSLAVVSSAQVFTQAVFRLGLVPVGLM